MQLQQIKQLAGAMDALSSCVEITTYFKIRFTHQRMMAIRQKAL